LSRRSAKLGLRELCRQGKLIWEMYLEDQRAGKYDGKRSFWHETTAQGAIA
jgi:hypothetical protein